jgi:2,4-dienoyl-CoA reductase-like NADH-dependent reductase (Old Yellow Enzyme family)
MPSLWEKTELNGLILKNRFFRSATWEGLATSDGKCTDQLVAFVSRLAEGNVGLIQTRRAQGAQTDDTSSSTHFPGRPRRP